VSDLLSYAHFISHTSSSGRLDSNLLRCPLPQEELMRGGVLNTECNFIYFFFFFLSSPLRYIFFSFPKNSYLFLQVNIPQTAKDQIARNSQRGTALTGDRIPCKTATTNNTNSENNHCTQQNGHNGPQPQRYNS
jgi:hypothetical protein